MHWVKYTFYGPWIESFQHSWWDPEFPQLLQMVQSLPGFLNLSLNVWSPCQVLGDVYTEVLEAAHPLHRGPTDHKRSVGPLLSLPEVHDQLFSFAHVQRETVVLAPWCKSLYLIQVCGLIIVVNEAQNHSIISKFNDRSGAVRGHAVVGVERVEQGAQDTALWGSYVQGDGVGGELADFHHLRSAGEDILNPVTKWRGYAEVWEFNSQLGGDYSIESGAIVDEKQPDIVAIFAVNVSEGGVQYLRDGIISRPIWPIGKLKRVQSSRDEEQMWFFNSLSKTFMTVDVRATGW